MLEIAITVHNNVIGNTLTVNMKGGGISGVTPNGLSKTCHYKTPQRDLSQPKSFTEHQTIKHLTARQQAPSGVWGCTFALLLHSQPNITVSRLQSQWPETFYHTGLKLHPHQNLGVEVYLRCQLLQPCCCWCKFKLGIFAT